MSPLRTWPPMLPHLKHLHSPGQRGGLAGPQGEEEIQCGLPGPSPQGLARLRGCGLRLLSLVAGILDEALPPPDEAWGLWGQMRQLPLPSAGPTEPGTQLRRRACRGPQWGRETGRALGAPPEGGLCPQATSNRVR